MRHDAVKIPISSALGTALDDANGAEAWATETPFRLDFFGAATILWLSDRVVNANRRHS